MSVRMSVGMPVCMSVGMSISMSIAMPVRIPIQTVVQTIHQDRTTISHLGSAPPHPLFVLLPNRETGNTEVLGHLPYHSIAESDINKD